MKPSSFPADPSLIWLLAFPEPALVPESSASPDALRDLLLKQIVQHSGHRKSEGHFRIDLDKDQEKFVIYIDSTLNTDQNEFCQVFYLDAGFWKGEYGTPEWKECYTRTLPKDLSKFHDVLQAVALDFWNASWLRYTVSNANGCKNAAATRNLLRNVCTCLRREAATVRETSTGLLARLAPVHGQPSLFAGNCYIPRQVDLLYLQYTESYQESNRWLQQLFTVLRHIATYEIALWLLARETVSRTSANQHLLEPCLRYVRAKAQQLPRLYDQWGEGFDTSLMSFLGRGAIEELLLKCI